MDKLDVIKGRVKGLQIFNNYGYQFIENEHYNQIKLKFPILDFIHYTILNNDLKRVIYIYFIKTNSLGYESNSFIVNISDLNKWNYEVISDDIEFDTYLKKRYKLSPISKMSLNNYDGTEEEKINAFFSFFEDILNDDLMKNILGGKIWSNDYKYTKD